MRSIRSEIGVAEEAAKLAKLARHLKAASRFAQSPLPSLWFLTDEARTPDPLLVAHHLPPGSGMVLRHYRAPDRAMLARELADIARTRGFILLIGADGALAREVGAHGVHLPRWAPGRAGTLKAHKIVTASAHSKADALRAQAIGAMAIFLGPIFPTLSHEGAQVFGPVRFSWIVHRTALPVIALGGVDAVNAARLIGSGAMGIGAIGALIPPRDDQVKISATRLKT